MKIVILFGKSRSNDILKYSWFLVTLFVTTSCLISTLMRYSSLALFFYKKIYKKFSSTETKWLGMWVNNLCFKWEQNIWKNKWSVKDAMRKTAHTYIGKKTESRDIWLIMLSLKERLVKLVDTSIAEEAQQMKRMPRWSLVCYS